VADNLAARMSARVAVLTARRWYRHLSHAVVLDFEDAMAEVADVTWHDLPPDSMSRRPLVTRSHVEMPESGPYDLALFVAMGPSWLRALRGVRGLDRAARSLVVYVFDAWPYQVRSLMRWRRQAARIDHLFVSFPEAVDDYAGRVPCPVHHLAQATSPTRFRPDGREPGIDVLSLGRRHAGAHRRLLELSVEEDLRYVFAETTSPNASDLQASRVLAGSLSRAARAHVSWPVELTDPGRAAGFSPITARWFETAACGSVLLGRRPASPDFEELFPYEGFVVDLDPDGEGFRETVLGALEMDDGPARLELAAHVRREHSWQRRCETILETALA